MEFEGTPYGDTRIRHLLTMSSGVRFDETYSGTDDVATLGRPRCSASEGGAATLLPFRTRERAAGERFHYASAETQVLGLVLRGATGKPLATYLSEKIWQPMGAEADATWNIDRGGYEAAYIGLNATLRDYARFGMLLANDGTLDGRSIIPAAWVRAATTPRATQFRPGMTGALVGNGYQTWVVDEKERQFMLRGLRGQADYVAPKSKLVIVHTAAGHCRRLRHRRNAIAVDWCRGEPCGETVAMNFSHEPRDPDSHRPGPLHALVWMGYIFTALCRRTPARKSSVVSRECFDPPACQ